MRGTLLVLLAGTLFVAACASALDAPSPTDTPTPAATATATEEAPPAAGLDGQALLQDRCTACHSLSRVERAQKTAEEWEATVNRMIEYGVVLSAEELDVLVQYLAETFPK